MVSVLQTINTILKPGGVVLFRDYGIYDMTQVRFLSKDNRKLANNYYLRADGTSSYYFSKEELLSIFDQAGFTPENLIYDTRELMNRKKCIKMYRVWLTGRFIKSH